MITVISFKFRDSRNKSYASSELLKSFHSVSDVVDAVSMKGKDDEALNMIWDFSGFTEWASSVTAASNEMANLNWYIFQSPNMFCKSYDSDDTQPASARAKGGNYNLAKHRKRVWAGNIWCFQPNNTQSSKQWWIDEFNTSLLTCNLIFAHEIPTCRKFKWMWKTWKIPKVWLHYLITLSVPTRLCVQSRANSKIPKILQPPDRKTLNLK